MADPGTVELTDEQYALSDKIGDLLERLGHEQALTPSLIARKVRVPYDTNVITVLYWLVDNRFIECTHRKGHAHNRFHHRRPLRIGTPDRPTR